MKNYYTNVKLPGDVQEGLCYALCSAAVACRRTEIDHGFGKQTPAEDIALMHSELSEALEEMRTGPAAGRKINETYYNADKPTKPEGVPSELADVIIRILGFCERNEIAIGEAVLEKMAYNNSRPFMHGNKAF